MPVESSALVPVVDAELAPLPVYGGAQMAQAFAAYRELQASLDKAMPDQIMEIGDRKFRKKGIWRATGVAFLLSVEFVDERREIDGAFHDGADNFGYLVTYRATAPNGRSVTGDGACFAIEKASRRAENKWGELPREATVHNVRAHAHTRAYNRAVSNLVGFGEVSAEEVERDVDDPRDAGMAPSEIPPSRRPPQRTAAVISEPQRKRLFAIARSHDWNDDHVRDLLARHGFEHANDVTREAYDAIVKAIETGGK